MDVCGFYESSKVPEMTVARAKTLLQEAGGVNAICREAGLLLARLESKSEDEDWIFLYPEDYTDAPAIASLFSKCENYSWEQ
jgi:hypothetical protein